MEIKPCPYSGTTGYLDIFENIGWVKCRCNICILLEAGYLNINNWNKRPLEDALNAKIERLNEQLQGFVTSNVELAETNIELLGRIDQLERENKILQIKANSSLANNLCPDHRDKQTGKPCLACEIERLERKLAALKAKIDGAAVMELKRNPYWPHGQYINVEIKPTIGELGKDLLMGQTLRFKLFPVEE